MQLGPNSGPLWDWRARPTQVWPLQGRQRPQYVLSTVAPAPLGRSLEIEPRLLSTRFIAMPARRGDPPQHREDHYEVPRLQRGRSGFIHPKDELPSPSPPRRRYEVRRIGHPEERRGRRVQPSPDHQYDEESFASCEDQQADFENDLPPPAPVYGRSGKRRHTSQHGSGSARREPSAHSREPYEPPPPPLKRRQAEARKRHEEPSEM